MYRLKAKGVQGERCKQTTVCSKFLIKHLIFKYLDFNINVFSFFLLKWGRGRWRSRTVSDIVVDTMEIEKSYLGFFTWSKTKIKEMNKEEEPTAIHAIPRKSFFPPNQPDVERTSFFFPPKLKVL